MGMLLPLPLPLLLANVAIAGVRRLVRDTHAANICMLISSVIAN